MCPSPSQVRPAPMIRVHETLEVTVQAPFAEHDDVVQALAANGADVAFDISSLPGGTRCRQHLCDPHGFDLSHDIFPEDPVAIAKRKAGLGVPGKGFPELLCGLLHGGGGMPGHGEVKNSAAVLSEHQKHIQHLGPNGWHGEDVHGENRLDVVFRKRAPSLHQGCEGGLRWRTMQLYLLILVSPTAMPSFSRSSLIGGATPERVVAAHRRN